MSDRGALEAHLGAWSKGTKIYGANLGVWWMEGGAQSFFPMVQGDSRVVIYACGRCRQNRSRIGRITLDWQDAPRVVEVSPDPVFDIGDLGCFDMDGMTYPCIVRHRGRLYLYYAGWNRLGGVVPFNTRIGLATSDDDGANWTRVSKAPILPLSPDEPIGHGSSAVIIEPGGAWTMYYTRILRWERASPQPKPYYNTWLASSGDGIHWTRLNQNIIPHEAGEYALGAPSISSWDGRRALWFTARGDFYRLFVSLQQDDGSFRRVPAPLHIPASDWDSQMQCYPHLITIGGRRHLMYCGNQYGREGVGYSTWTGG